MKKGKGALLAIAVSCVMIIAVFPARAAHHDTCHHFDETNGAKCMHCIERVWIGHHWKLVNTCKHHHGSHHGHGYQHYRHD